MLVARVLVPVDVEAARVAGGTERPRHDITVGAPTVSVYGRQAGLALRKEVFAEAMLENSLTRAPRPVRNFVVSAMAQLLFLLILLVLPLYFTEAIDLHQLNQTLLVAPPAAPAPPPPPAATRSVAPRRRALSLAAKLVVPSVIPNHVALHTEEPSGADLTAAIVPGDGIPGGVPGGQPGGVIAGTLSGPTPAPPIDSAPKAPIRAGGKVKAPRLAFGPDPVYPVLARQARIGGAVVIDAVIDAQGNVVGMRTVSGPPILALAAMEALRLWKYEPTILGGEAIPVQLLVTFTFAPKGPQA